MFEDPQKVTQIAAVLNEYNHWDARIESGKSHWNTVGHFESKADALDHAYYRAQIFHRLDVFEIQELADIVEGDIYVAIDSVSSID
jgi:hypothetical protein